MRILVLNGSPAGEDSLTLFTVRYWEKHFPEHEWQVLHVGQRIRAMEKDHTFVPYFPGVIELLFQVRDNYDGAICQK